MTDSRLLTIDIRISGCATRCWHCYVNGEPDPIMPLDEYLYCLDALEPIVNELEKHGFTIYLYLDYEPLLHPEICRILAITKGRFGKNYQISCIPTTGIPLGIRPDWKDIIGSLKDIGINEMELTLHGTRDIHNKATNNSKAFDLHQLAIERAKKHGLKIHLNLMLNKEMLQCFDETMAIIEQNEYDYKRATIATYEPTLRMRQFEEHRPSIEDINPYRELLSSFSEDDGQNGYWKEIDKYSESNVYQDIMGNPENYPSFAIIEEKMPNWVFVTIIPGRSIYYGNVGLYHKKLGMLGVESSLFLAEYIKSLKPNYQFGGFFDVDKLPIPIDAAKRVGNPLNNSLYNRVEDVFLRWLDLCETANILN